MSEEDASPYCPECGSCGESGCCPPTLCKEVRCIYGEYNLKEYKALLDENEAYRKEVARLSKILTDHGIAYEKEKDTKST